MAAVKFEMKLRSKDDPLEKLYFSVKEKLDKYLVRIKYVDRFKFALFQLIEIGKSTGIMPHYEESKQLHILATEIAQFLFETYPTFIVSKPPMGHNLTFFGKHIFHLRHSLGVEHSATSFVSDALDNFENQIVSAYEAIQTTAQTNLIP